MKTKFCSLMFVIFVLAVSACGGRSFPSETRPGQNVTLPAFNEENVNLPSILRTLDELAEVERAGAWFQGLGLTESNLRESAGDFPGAIAAAYKELSWAYGMGFLEKKDLEQGLSNLLTIKGEDSVTATTNAISAFLNEQWSEASIGLVRFFNEKDEPDGFGRWMILVCALELSAREHTNHGGLNRQASEAYKSIRARYAQFPEYWYRGAKAFSGTIAAEFAENCINSSPNGPFAPECRSILASFAGLRIEDGLSIRTKREIEAVITQSVNSGNPQFLDSLMPLISLPDNPYTVYAVGALRALTNISRFQDYFNAQAASAKGRLAERLLYICRG